MLTLHPLDFEEFLWALDQKDLANMIRKAFSEDKEFSLHSLANEYYRLYLAIGGMPRAILEYKEKQDMDFATKNFGFENDIKCIPLYSVFCLDNL